MKILEFLKTASSKNLVIYIVVLTLLIGLLVTRTGSVGKNLAEPLDLEEYGKLPAYGVQDLRSWGQGEVRLTDEPLDMSSYRIYMYKLDTELLEEYIAMMEKNGFTLVDEHHQSSFIGSYQSYGLVCDAASDVPTMEMMYTDTPCHVNIWESNRKWRVEVCQGLEMLDMGLRRDGSVVSVLPQGESAGAGLKRASADTYKTTDGRFKTELNHAAVICNGEEAECAATWKRSGDRVTVSVTISDEISAEITYHEKEVKQGDLFRLGTVEEHPATVRLIAGDKKITAEQTGYPNFLSATLRIMYLGEEGDVVLYLYAQPMDTKTYPESIELLCAVNTTPEEKEEQSGGGGGGINWDDDDEPYVPDYAKPDCLTCGGDGDCNTCGGYGEVERYAGGGDTVTSKCSSCYGSGNCRTCGGSGKR